MRERGKQCGEGGVVGEGRGGREERRERGREGKREKERKRGRERQRQRIPGGEGALEAEEDRACCEDEACSQHPQRGAKAQGEATSAGRHLTFVPHTTARSVGEDVSAASRTSGTGAE
eukprot:171708-Rhodomonas_salina.1